jgi:hypothetical protein
MQERTSSLSCIQDSFHGERLRIERELNGSVGGNFKYLCLPKEGRLQKKSFAAGGCRLYIAPILPFDWSAFLFRLSNRDSTESQIYIRYPFA